MTDFKAIMHQITPLPRPSRWISGAYF